MWENGVTDGASRSLTSLRARYRLRQDEAVSPLRTLHTAQGDNESPSNLEAVPVRKGLNIHIRARGAFQLRFRYIVRVHTVSKRVIDMDRRF